MTLRLPIDTGTYQGEIRVLFEDGRWLVRGALVLPWRILSPFYTIKEFDNKVKATDYATTLVAAFLDVPTSEVTDVQ